MDTSHDMWGGRALTTQPRQTAAATDLGLELPVEVPTLNGQPARLLVEDGVVKLRQEGRNTLELSEEAVQVLWEALPVAAREARTDAPDAQVFRLRRRR